MANIRAQADLSPLIRAIQNWRAGYKPNPDFTSNPSAPPTLENRSLLMKLAGTPDTSAAINMDRALALQRLKESRDNALLEHNLSGLKGVVVPDMNTLDVDLARFHPGQAETYGTTIARELDASRRALATERTPDFASAERSGRIASEVNPVIRNLAMGNLDSGINFVDPKTGLPTSSPMEVNPATTLSYDEPYFDSKSFPGHEIFRGILNKKASIPGSVTDIKTGRSAIPENNSETPPFTPPGDKKPTSMNKIFSGAGSLFSGIPSKPELDSGLEAQGMSAGQAQTNQGSTYKPKKTGEITVEQLQEFLRALSAQRNSTNNLNPLLSSLMPSGGFGRNY